MATKNYGWMTLQSGQVYISAGYNKFVNELDDLIYGLSNIVGIETGIIKGLGAEVIGNSIVIGEGCAIVNGVPFATKGETVVPDMQSGYVVIRKIDNTAKIVTTSSPLPDDILIAQFDLQSQTITDKRTFTYIGTTLIPLTLTNFNAPTGDTPILRLPKVPNAVARLWLSWVYTNVQGDSTDLAIKVTAWEDGSLLWQGSGRQRGTPIATFSLDKGLTVSVSNSGGSAALISCVIVLTVIGI